MRTFLGEPLQGFHLPWVFAAFLLPLMTACATTRAPEGESTEGGAVGVGYGDVEEEHLVGSVASSRMEDQEVVHSRTVAHMLARIPGVRVLELPGGQMSVRIRGMNSILGGEEPLYVIDGMVVQSGAGILGLSPSTIESITVLKDAGSTAIYGSRGANGVILIKTKRGFE